MSDRHRSARYAFAASSLAPDLFHVLRFEGEEAVSQPYRFTVHLLSDDPDIEFSDLIDKPATLTLFRGDDPAELNGIVVDFQQAEKRDGQSEYRFAYTAVLAPRLWRLALSFQSRIFQNLTVEEIVSKVLQDAGVDFAFELHESYEPREYCTQYKETDLQFVQRLLEFEGIRYCFKHDGGTETLLLTDTGDAPPIVDGEEVAYRDQGGLLSAESVETVGGFVARQQLVTGTSAVKDYNYRTPAEPLQSESALDTAQAVGTQSDFGMHLTTPKRADRIALVRNQEIESGRRVMNGKGDCLRFRSGHRFALAEHYRDSFNQKYVLTHVRHEGSNEGADGAGEEGGPPDYRNTFVCVPAGVAYRPPRLTPEPKLPGVLTAKVESGGGTYAPIDDQGRYRVRMPFDLGDAGAAQATKPVRLAQPYTGPGYGQHFPVHKEAEMVIACVDGNVDRILGLSTIYNPSQFSPVTSENPTENTVRTAADNHIVLQDLKGSVGIDIATPTAASRIHLGAPENAVEGIQSSTNATQSIYAGQGVFIKTGGTADLISAITAASDLGELGSNMTMVDGAVGVALAALGAGGQLFTKAFRNSAINAAVGTAMGLAYPGVYVISEGGVMMGTPAGISGYAGAGGISFVTPTGIDLAAGALGINLVAGAGGINLGVGVGDVHASTGRGDVKAETKLGHVEITAHNGRMMGRAKNVVQLTSETGNVQFQAPDGNGTITSFAGKDVMVEAKKNIVSDAGEDFALKTGKDFTVFAGKHARIKAEDQLSLVCGQAEIVLTKNGDITIKNAGNKIELKATSVSISGQVDVKLNGVNVSAEGSASIDLKSNGQASLKGTLTKVG